MSDDGNDGEIRFDEVVSPHSGSKDPASESDFTNHSNGDSQLHMEQDFVYAKVFKQIYDSSIADNWKVRVVFMDMLVLADSEGFVDMTATSIAATTRYPLEMVNEAIEALESPDPLSRTRAHEGRRIVRIDPERPWGWKIVNYETYRNMRMEFQRKEYMRGYMQNRRRSSKEQDEMLNSVKLEFNTSLTEFNSVNSSPSPSSLVLRGSAEGESQKNPLPPEAELWNKLVKGSKLSQVRDVGSGRMNHLRARRKDPFFVENFEAAIKKALNTPFCTGSKNWKVSFDFMLKPDSVTKIIEGAYDDMASTKSKCPF